jgi:hypothetical protein
MVRSFLKEFEKIVPKHVLNVAIRNTSPFERTCIHLVQAIMTKWGMSTILLAFLAPKGEDNSFFTPKK